MFGRLSMLMYDLHPMNDAAHKATIDIKTLGVILVISLCHFYFSSTIYLCREFIKSTFHIVIATQTFIIVELILDALVFL